MAGYRYCARTVALVGSVALAVVSCNQSTSPTAPDSLAVASATASETVPSTPPEAGGAFVAKPGQSGSTFHFTAPFFLTFFNPCVPELIDVAGESHITIHSSLDAQGNSHFRFVSREDQTAVGQETDIEYRAFGVNTGGGGRNPLFFDCGPGVACNSSLIARINIIAPTHENSARLSCSFQVTKNAAGEITAYFDTGCGVDRVFCRGN